MTGSITYSQHYMSIMLCHVLPISVFCQPFLPKELENCYSTDPELDNWVRAGPDGPVAKIVFVSVTQKRLVVVCQASR